MGAIWRGPTRNPMEPARSKRMSALFPKYTFRDRFYSILGSKWHKIAPMTAKSPSGRVSKKHCKNMSQKTSKLAPKWGDFSDVFWPQGCFFLTFLQLCPKGASMPPKCSKMSEISSKIRLSIYFSTDSPASDEKLWSISRSPIEQKLDRKSMRNTK